MDTRDIIIAIYIVKIVLWVHYDCEDELKQNMYGCNVFLSSEMAVFSNWKEKEKLNI